MTLDILGITGCLALLAVAVYLPIHERHLDDFLAAGALAAVALAGIVEIIPPQRVLHALRHINGWHLLIGGASYAIVLARILGLIPERFYLNHGRKRHEAHR